jgi:hypothetical protein
MNSKIFIAGLMVFILLFGCINISQTQDTGPGTQQPVKPPKQPVPKPPKNVSNETPEPVTNDSESTEPTTPIINITKKPLTNFSKTNYSKDPQITIFKNKTMNVDLYGFINKTPDFKGLPEPTPGFDCEGACDDYCEDDVKTCQSACDFSWNQVCANAAAASGVCQASCAAIPFPWLIADCVDTCQDKFEEACDVDDLNACKNHCAGDHYDLCIDTCYDLC